MFSINGGPLEGFTSRKIKQIFYFCETEKLFTAFRRWLEEGLEDFKKCYSGYLEYTRAQDSTDYDLCNAFDFYISEYSSFEDFINYLSLAWKKLNVSFKALEALMLTIDHYIKALFIWSIEQNQVRRVSVDGISFMEIIID